MEGRGKEKIRGEEREEKRKVKMRGGERKRENDERRLQERKRALENVMIKKKRGDANSKRRDMIGN